MPNPWPGFVFLLHMHLMRGKQLHTQQNCTQTSSPNAFPPHHLPQDCLLVNLLQHGTSVRVAAIENAAVAHLPDRPSCEDHQGVQPFSSSFRRPACSPSPPNIRSVKCILEVEHAYYSSTRTWTLIYFIF